MGKMFYYKDQKFHKKGVAFAIPDGTFLLEEERQSEDLFEIGSADLSFAISIVFESFCEPADYFRSEDFKDCYTVIEEPKEIRIGSFFGQKSVYRDRMEQFCEYRLKITDKNEVISTLSVLIRTDKPETDITSVCDHHIVKELLQSLVISKE